MTRAAYITGGVSTKKIAVAVLIAILFMMTFAVMPVMGIKGTEVNGKWVVVTSTMQYGDHKHAGANVIMDIYVEGAHTGGSIVGAFEQTSTAIYHYKDPEVVAGLNENNPTLNPEAQFNWVDMKRTFTTATILGHTGGLTMRLQATGFGNNFKGPAYFDLQGTWVIISGTADLANIHGQGTWWHSRTGFAGLEYEGQIHFDP